MKISNLKKWLYLVAAMLLVITGAQVINHKKTQMESISPAKTYGVVVPVDVAEQSQVNLTVPYLAEVQSDSDVDLASKVTSRVEMIVTSGSRVKAGDTLVKLDDSDLLAKKKSLALKIKEVSNQIKAKIADLESLKSTHKRNKKLLDIQAVSQEKFDTEASKITSLNSTIEGMKNNSAALKQNIEEIDDTLSYTTIKSPMDGVVSKTFVAEGGIASGGKPLLSLSGGEGKRFLVRVSDNINPRTLLYADQSCPLHSLNSTYNGLNEYNCQIQTTLSAGNRVEVKLVVYSGENILLPSNAVLQLNDKQYVLLVDGDKAKPQQVKITAEGSEGLLVDGISAGDEYVVAKPDILLKLLTGINIIKAKS